MPRRLAWLVWRSLPKKVRKVALVICGVLVVAVPAQHPRVTLAVLIVAVGGVVLVMAARSPVLARVLPTRWRLSVWLRWRCLTVVSGLARPTRPRSRRLVRPRTRLRATPAGWHLTVTPTIGTGPEDVAARVDELTAIMGARVRARVLPSGLAEIDVVTRDLLAAMPVIGDASALPRVTGLESVELGQREDGQPWRLPLDGGSIVVGGEPGGGKSVTISALLCGVAARDDVQIVAVDLKQLVELGEYAPRCAGVAGDQLSAGDVLVEVEHIRGARMDALRAQGLTSVARRGYDRDWPLILVVIDEVAELVVADGPSKEAKDHATALVRLLSRLVRLGRAAGISVVLSTQKPTADALPTVIRDAAAVKVATKCTAREQARAFLGDFADNASVCPTQISRALRGVAVTDTPDAGPLMVRAHFIPEKVRRQVVEATAHLRRELHDLIPEPAWADPAPTTKDTTP